MDINTFKQTDPGLGTVRLFITDVNKVSGMTVSLFNCNQVNFSYTLSQVTTVTINDTEIPINTKTLYSPTHFYFETTPTDFDITATNLDDACFLIDLAPFIDPVPFTYNTYNALLGNSETSRNSSFVYDVDRSSDQIKPKNIEAILTDTAALAKFQDLNYTSIGITNSRYNGAKTNREDYGTSPAITVIPFEGVEFGVDVDNNRICSQSANITSYDSFGFIISTPGQVYNSIPIQPTQDYPTAVTASVLGALGDAKIEGSSGLTVTSTQTQLIVEESPGTEIVENDILVIRPWSTGSAPLYEDFVEVQSVSRASGTTTLQVKRGLLGISRDVTELNINNTLYLYKVKSDVIYRINGNQINKLGRKKLYIPDTGQILLISNEGRVVKIEKTCGL